MIDQWYEKGINYYVSGKEGDSNSEWEGRERHREDNTWIGLGKINTVFLSKFMEGNL